MAVTEEEGGFTGRGRRGRGRRGNQAPVIHKRVLKELHVFNVHTRQWRQIEEGDTPWPPVFPHPVSVLHGDKWYVTGRSIRSHPTWVLDVSKSIETGEARWCECEYPVYVPAGTDTDTLTHCSEGTTLVLSGCRLDTFSEEAGPVCMAVLPEGEDQAEVMLGVGRHTVVMCKESTEHLPRNRYGRILSRTVLTTHCHSAVSDEWVCWGREEGVHTADGCMVGPTTALLVTAGEDRVCKVEMLDIVLEGGDDVVSAGKWGE
ncbi:hypothetical protein KIPB_013839 [Kipferlia bialata]|uniref:Uncharacterized protein n=1 Tax=Kipferlia bialata TaxID=797122 RepID=A0A391NSR0_9EUKA|nr:hypothetical protein KIPB_013839 [Kipferlia bialata]|eukprot:g13839.t1